MQKQETNKPVINVFCKNKGWLFEDLKQEIAKHGAVATCEPLINADAWICIRTEERHKVRKRDKTVVQIHGQCTKEPIINFGAISFVHQVQKDSWEGFNSKHLVLPIGSRDIPYSSKLPNRPTIGFFCREVGNLKRSKMFKRAVLHARKELSSDFDVLMIGENLDHIADIGKYEVRDAKPEDYKKVDALVTTSVSQMIPLSAYEMCALGRTVITTPRIWPNKTDWPMVRTGDTVEELAKIIDETVRTRKLYEPEVIYNRSDWAKAQIELAKELL